MKLDLVISNHLHHTEMFLPLVQALVRDNISCRVLSLCEFRGLKTPTRAFEQAGASVRKIMPRRFRKSSMGAQTGRGRDRIARRFVRQVSWSLLLQRPLQEALRERPRIVVLPNDAAFPYDRLCGFLHEMSIPYMLVQEGIRFPIPAAGERYGTSGCAAIAAWGENSVEFFRRQGVDENVIHCTGNPRYDSIAEECPLETSTDVLQHLGSMNRTLLLVTNPIDDLGFCTSREKLDLVHSFIENLTPLFNDPDFCLIVKLHGRESYSAYQAMVARTGWKSRIHLMQKVPLHGLLQRCRAAVVLASTAGLEALLHGCTLGVIPIPGRGFIHDYVEAGAALGLCLDATLPDQVRQLFAPDEALTKRGAQYAASNLVADGSATARIVALIGSLTNVAVYPSRLPELSATGHGQFGGSI